MTNNAPLKIEISFSEDAKYFLRSLFGNREANQADQGFKSLSRREKEFADLRNEGLDYRQIAERCGVSRQHVHKTLLKADAKLAQIDEFKASAKETLGRLPGLGFEDFMEIEESF